jgi:uncharacterized protein (TIGR02466 family)
MSSTDFQKNKIFPVEIYEFHNPDIDNEDLIERLKSRRNPAHGITSTNDVHDDELFNDLFGWINSCLDEIIKDKRYDMDKLSVTSSWSNCAEANAGLASHAHKHSLSMFSGVYYCTHGAPILFEDPLHQRLHAQIEVLQHEYEPLIALPPYPGKLIIFPSWMYHSTEPHHEDYDRWVVAFNTLPSGNINVNLARDSIANIQIGQTPKWNL